MGKGHILSSPEIKDFTELSGQSLSHKSRDQPLKHPFTARCVIEQQWATTARQLAPIYTTHSDILLCAVVDIMHYNCIYYVFNFFSLVTLMIP